MPNSDAFALRQSGFNEFLFAPIGIEANGMTLSLVSVFARAGHDPWQEAGRLAGLPRPEATANLARTITNMPASIWPLQAATAIADRLIALLPTRSGGTRQTASTPARSAKASQLLGLALAIVCIAFALAFQAGIFTTSEKANPDGSSMASFTTAPGLPPGAPGSSSASTSTRSSTR